MKSFPTVIAAALTLAAAALFAPGAAMAQTGAEKELNIFIWSEYIDPDLITEFERTRNVKVRMDYYESNEEMIAKLHQMGNQSVYDLIVPSTYFIPALMSLGLIQPLDHARLGNVGNIDPKFRDIEEDPGLKHVVPYQWGTSGLAVRARDGVRTPNSWSVIFSDGPEKGNFILFDTARDSLGSALKSLGYSFNSTDLNQIREAGELLTRTKKHPAFMGFDSGVGGLSKVMGRVAYAAQVYSGEAIKAAREDPGLAYIVPEEGCEIWLDVLAIPKDAPNADAAYEFLNYILEPQVGARIASFNNYATPNKAAIEFIPAEDLANKGMYPPQSLLDKMEYMKDLGEMNRLFDETWTIVKSR
ncbi:MAG: spermidine/putrescine ABC transporter substrate-binding protein [Deltaproteobacteria bacterium]|jgi:spermidine/putrescine transport system substrate-binding protein|nr:spermidine/putrescine ABC transporter substrate-binding protein [Deltaproteobacteria bacterium]